VSTGTTISSFYDPLLAKIIVSAETRDDAVMKLSKLLSENNEADGANISIYGPPNNVSFLHQIMQESIFREGKATTEWVDNGGVLFIPRCDGS